MLETCLGIRRLVLHLCFHSIQHNGILEINSTKSDWFGEGARTGAHWEETVIPTSGSVVAFISMHTRASWPKEEVWVIITGQARQSFDQGSEACIHSFGNPVIVFKKWRVKVNNFPCVLKAWIDSHKTAKLNSPAGKYELMKYFCKQERKKISVELIDDTVYME